ncbi:MAG: acyl carrier protein [Halothiobacillaceae bacterium]
MRLSDDRADTLAAVREVLIETLSLGPQGRQLTEDSPLFGSVPELDSMGVVLVLTALEDRFDVQFPDDEIDASWFATLGSLVEAVEARLEAR